MGTHVCPWWWGPVLANPLRRWLEDPAHILSPHLRPGMTVMEPGPGMGFFTLELARLTGPTGRVVAVDLQPRMLAGLKRRAKKAGLEERIETRVAEPERLGVDDLKEKIDFVLAFAMVHELPSPQSFFNEVAPCLKPGGCMLLAEPKGHVTEDSFTRQVKAAEEAGLIAAERPAIKRNMAVVMKKR